MHCHYPKASQIIPHVKTFIEAFPEHSLVLRFRPYLTTISKAPFPPQLWCKTGVMSIKPLLTWPTLPPPPPVAHWSIFPRPPVLTHLLSAQQPGEPLKPLSQIIFILCLKPSNGSLFHPEKKPKSSMAYGSLQTCSLPNSFTFIPYDAPPCSLHSSATGCYPFETPATVLP